MNTPILDSELNSSLISIMASVSAVCRYDGRLDDGGAWLKPGYTNPAWKPALAYSGAAAKVTSSAATGTVIGSTFCGVAGVNPPPNPGNENYETLTLKCDAVGATVANVTFAQWGVLAGSCSSGWAVGPCGSVSATESWVCGTSHSFYTRFCICEHCTKVRQPFNYV